MIKEYTGRSEKEAIANAVKDLGLDKAEFDVEIMGSEQGGLFKKGRVTIKVHIEDGIVDEELEVRDPQEGMDEPFNEEETKAITFAKSVIEKMGYPCKIYLDRKENNRIVLDIQTSSSSILIGKHGRNLDALQFLLNVYNGKNYPDSSTRFILDIEGYKTRREESLVRMARKVAGEVAREQRSRLLEPMNPFERRLIHTTLNDRKDVYTESEGEGLYKRVRILTIKE